MSKITYFMGFLKEVVNINLPFQNTLSWNPATGLQLKKKIIFFSFGKIFDHFLHL